MKNFFIVGAQRCATSWLYEALDKQQGIHMIKPRVPELKFFLQKPSHITRHHYLQLCKEGINGEKSTTYIESTPAATRIKKTFPKAKVIICLRNPVQRALSNYFFSCSSGLETRTLKEAFITNTKHPPISLKASTNPFAYIERGIYSKYIEAYKSIFPASQIFITFMEKFTKDLKEFELLVRWLGKDGEIDFNLPCIVNNSSRNQIVSGEVFSHLASYYQKDTAALIKNHHLFPPYADSLTQPV